MKRRIALLVGLGYLVFGMGLAMAQTTHLFLNSTYVPPRPDRGWVRVAPSGWKHSMDDAITNTSLIKFDISAIPQGATIQSARLGFYVQESEQNHQMYVRWVDTDNDSWSYLNNTPGELRGWGPTSLIEQYQTGQVGLKEINVTSWIQTEVQLEDHLFSVKFDHGEGSSYAIERIASPDAWYSPHRPYLDVVFTSPQTVNPDLTLSRHDIAFSTMWPVPYDPVTITATVHNVGGLATDREFYVRFLDNGQQIGTDVRIDPPVPGGGGWAPAQITWYPTEGVHDIEVIADVTNQIQNEIREDNNTNTDLSNDGEAYTYEVRPQYKFYTESFETENPPGQWGRYKKDADESWNIGMGRQSWNVERINGAAYDGSWYLRMYLQTSYDNGTVWVERPVPIPANPDAVSLVELSYFAHDGHGEHGYYSTRMRGEWWGPDLEEDFQTGDVLSPPTWRRYRSCNFLGSLRLPEYWVSGGYRQSSTWGSEENFFDLFTIRVDPPRSTQANATATAFNNGAKFVWDGLSYHHLVYMSGDSIFYVRSEDGVGDVWSQAEHIGYGQFPAIALDIDGYPRVVWVGWAGGPALFYRKRSDTGWSPLHVLISYPPGYEIGVPSLAIDPTYHGHVAYENWGLTPPFSDIMYGYFDATQNYPPLYTQSVDNLTDGRCQNPAIALDYLTPHIVYSRPPNSGAPDDVYHAEPGNPWPTFNVSSSPSVTSTHPHIAIQESKLQVVWSEKGDEILHRARDPWFWWGLITNVSNTPGGASDYPRIVMPGYHVVWMDKSERWSEEFQGPPDFKNPWQVYYTFPWPDPGTWTPATNIVPTYEDASYPHATLRQTLIGDNYLDVAHTEGDQSLYTIEISHKQLTGGPPPGGGDMLLAINADEVALGGSRALWKKLTFKVPRDLDVSFAIAGAADNQDEMKLVLDNRDFGWNTTEAWNGRELRGQRKVVKFRVPLKKGEHTLELHASGKPVFKGLRAWYGKIGGGPQSGELALGIPKESFLAQSYPNPTFGKATIAYGLSKEGPVKLSIYNALGQVVRELVSENQRPGFHRVEWDGKSQAGKQVTSGIYFYRLNAGGFSKTNKLVVVR